ncbi:MAG: alpha/beta fold hydrolase [Candidatus Roseilinea sp.]|uniref:alpha/beta fold hydrolase n=1 Tax=Candidatus Roseilinea sp. TaxID=2838777 RepID=UPI00404B6595
MENKPGRANVIAPIVTTTGLLAVLGAGLAWIAHSRRNIFHDIPMTAALAGELKMFESSAGAVAYYVAGPYAIGARSAPPMVFVHSINAAPSSAEMRPLFEHYASSRRVYAIDLPGFGFSERRDIAYSPQLYRDVINKFVAEIVGGPVDAVALSLSAEFLAQAATARGELYRSLILLSPTGVSRRAESIQPNEALHRLLRVPIWSRPLFDLLTSRPSTRLFLFLSQRNGFDRDLSDYAYITSHQPGAEHAPFHFLAGKLFTPGIFDVYRALDKPVLMLYGDGLTAQYDRVDELRRRPNWRIHHLKGCGELVQFDNPDMVIARIDEFLAGLQT